MLDPTIEIKHGNLQHHLNFDFDSIPIFAIFWGLLICFKKLSESQKKIIYMQSKFQNIIQ